MAGTRRGSTTAPKGRATPARPRQSRPKPPSITFRGEEYRIAEKIGIWPLLQLARAAEAGVSMADQKGLAATHALLQDVIHPDDWGRFQEDMISGKVDDLGELMKATQQATELMATVQTRRNGSRPRRTVTASVESRQDRRYDDDEDGEEDPG